MAIPDGFLIKSEQSNHLRRSSASFIQTTAGDNESTAKTFSWINFIDFYFPRKDKKSYLVMSLLIPQQYQYNK
jgi:hypothetical protein